MNETATTNSNYNPAAFSPTVGLDILRQQIAQTQTEATTKDTTLKEDRQNDITKTIQNLSQGKINEINYIPKFEDLNLDQQVALTKLRDNLKLDFVKTPTPANLIEGIQAQSQALVNQQFVPTKIKSYQEYQKDIASKLPSLQDLSFQFNPSSYIKLQPTPEYDPNATTDFGLNSTSDSGNTSDWLDPIDGLGQVTSTHLQARGGRGQNGVAIGTNNGIDIGVGEGTPIRAMQDGVVMGKQFHKEGYGNVVTVQTGDGTQYSFAHMKDPALLNDGVTVKKGDIIGYVGKTGTATGYHLSLQMGKGQFNPKTGRYITSAQAKDGNLASNPLDFIRNKKDTTPKSQSTGFAQNLKFRNILDAGIKSPVANQIFNYFSPKYGVEVAQKMTVLANLEGGWKPDAEVANSGEQSFGTFQINLNAHNDKVAKYTGTKDINTNAKWLSNLTNSLKITEEIYKQQGFKPWTAARKSVKTYAGVLGNGVLDF